MNTQAAPGPIHKVAMMRVLLVAHSCSPNGGSEARMTWQWATHLALEGVHVTALINRADPTSPIDPRHATLPPGIPHGCEPQFIDVEPPVLSRRLPVVAYTAGDYQIWQRRALKTARRLHEAEPFDLVHHLSWASIHHGSQLHRLGAPFVLGPVGGGTRVAAGYRPNFPNSWRYEQVRNFLVRLARFNPASRQLVRNAELILASNPETREVLQRMGAADVQVMLDDGVDPGELQSIPVTQSTEGPLRVLWVSRIMERKALGMALDAIEASAAHCSIRMTLMGDGPPRANVADQINRMTAMGLVDDWGWANQDALEAAYASHDVLLFNSVRDNGGAPLHAASAYGLPAVVINHQGPGIITNDEWAVRLNPSTNEQSTNEIADALIELANNPERRQAMGMAALEAGQRNTWPARAQEMRALYQKVLGPADT